MRATHAVRSSTRSPRVLQGQAALLHAVLPLQTLASHLNILSADGRALCGCAPGPRPHRGCDLSSPASAHDLGRPVVRKPHMRLFGIVDWSIGSQKALIEVCESKMRRVSVPLGAPCTPPLLWFLTHAQLNVFSVA